MSHIIVFGHQLVTFLQVGIYDAVYDFLMGLQEVVQLSMDLLYKAIEIFWIEAFRKPPDKADAILDNDHVDDVDEAPPYSPLLLEEE